MNKTDIIAAHMTMVRNKAPNILERIPDAPPRTALPREWQSAVTILEHTVALQADALRAHEALFAELEHALRTGESKSALRLLTNRVLHEGEFMLPDDMPKQ